VLLDKYGMTLAQLMLNWVTYGDAVVAIPKASSLEHVEQNTAAIRTRISGDEYRAVSMRFE
jgi:diketogulonate reductase-like aldo/keto reductase